ncbi:Kelch-like protein 40a [Orchesella cincta]|uniref:Kelch-like protein 40a n=1 Tax=Orchesella cincta TaxID=48709 RepID=A0A1D2MC48_ORCCI|nr:Kelch-like protein 40a [Orchesella cincta]
MESIQRQAYLVKDKSINHFHWAPQLLANSTCPGHAILYEGNFEDTQLWLIESNANGTPTDTVSAVNQILKQSTERSCIEMSAKNDDVKSDINISVSTLFGSSFVQNISNVLAEPKLTIEGKFNRTEPFKLAGLELRTASHVENFEGASKISQFLKKYSNYSGFNITYSIILEWQDLKLTVRKEQSTVLDKLLSNKLLTDCCIIAENSKEVSCHRSILAVSSDVIYAMLTSGLQESQTNKIDMTDIDEEVVGLLLVHLYGRDINTVAMKEEIAYDLLRTAHKYNISSLQELMTVTIFNKPNDSFNMNTVLNLYFFTLRVEELNPLHKKVLNILKINPNKVLASTVYQELLEKSPKEASKLALKLLGLVIVGTNSASQTDYPGQAALLEGSWESFEVYQDNSVSINGNTLSAIKQALQLSTAHSCIYLFVVNDQKTNVMRLSARIVMDDAVVKTLSNLLTEPKLAINGKIHNTNFSISDLNLQTINCIENIDGSMHFIQEMNAYGGLTRFGVTYSLLLSWVELKMTTTVERSSTLDILFKEKLLSDCYLQTATAGDEVSCHKNILAANSDVFRELVTNSSESVRLDLSTMCTPAVNLLVAFVYGQEINVEEMNEQIAFELLQTAHTYHITKLEKLMIVTLFNRSDDRFEMDMVLAIYRFTLDEEALNELCNKMLRILKRDSNKLLASTVYQELLDKSPKEASKLALKLLGIVTGGSNLKALPPC